jgi:hypothetical protein
LCLALAARALQGGTGALPYATYLGGDGADIIHATAIDASNNVYLTGENLSSNFPVTAGAVQTRPAGNSDVFVRSSAPTDSSVASGFTHGKSEISWLKLVVPASKSRTSWQPCSKSY